VVFAVPYAAADWWLASCAYFLELDLSCLEEKPSFVDLSKTSQTITKSSENLRLD
jgi:hypothetical protein